MINDYVHCQAGVLRKAAGPAGTVSLVDIYGTLLGSRLFVPSSYDTLNPQHLSLHMMRRNIDKGQHPMPIFTAIQHSKIHAIYSLAVFCLKAERVISCPQPFHLWQYKPCEKYRPKKIVA